MTEMQRMPQVELDITLAELYTRDRVSSRDGRIALVPCCSNSEVALTSKFARSTKYLYQESTFSTTPEDVPSQQLGEIRHAAAVKFLSLVPQRDAFAAGNMPVILFDLEPANGSTARSKEDTQKTMSTLKAHQRPELLFFPGPSQIATEENRIDLLEVKTALDELEGSPLGIGLDTHYFLNTKTALCKSGLPSPKSILLELDGFSADAKSCCTTCRQADGHRSIPASCTGTRGQWLKRQIAQTLSRISSQQLPFVLKCQQTFGGGGTWFVSTPSELSNLKTTLSTLLLPKLFSQVNASNAHLKPATLILSEMIRDPISDWGLPFFVTKVGECIPLGVTHQVFDSTKAWIGNTITYTDQDRLKARFTPIMRQIGAWLHSHGYYGPCGADILETAPTDNNNASPGTQNLHIVDLNVRIPGSLVLGLMRCHFSQRRGLHEASSFSLRVKMARDSFILHFADWFREGRIVIVAWYEDAEYGVSFGNVVIGAKNKSELEKQTLLVKEIAAEIHF